MDSKQAEVLDFWFRELTPQDWFAAGEKLDPIVRTRFEVLHGQAVEGELDHWQQSPLGRLALILILDQFSRHIFRHTADAFAQDLKAQKLALEGISAKDDQQLSFAHRQFFYMPLMHAEDIDIQNKSIEYFTSLKDNAAELLAFAQKHRAEITRFGRFPHRNEILSRPSTQSELNFLEPKIAEK